MNSLNPSQPLMMIMAGLPGSGKSFFADQFSETFKAPLVSADKLRQTITEASSFSREENRIVSTLVRQQVVELLKTNKTVIVDGVANTRLERVELTRLAKTSGYRTLLIWTQVDEPTALWRSTKPNRRVKHFDPAKTVLTRELFDQFKKHFSNPLRNEDYLALSGKHTYATQAKIVLKRIVEPRSTILAAPRPTQTNNDDQKPNNSRIIIR